MSVTVTVNGKSGPSVVATSGDTISAAVTKNAVVSVTASAAAAPGATGPQGPPGAGGGGVSLSDATPAALGTAAAGTSSTASRSDHVHALPTIAYSALSGVPSTFAPSTHTHTASQITDFATESAKYGPVLSVNGMTGAVTVSGGGSSVTLSDATPSALGTAAPGTSSNVSRADHVHQLPTIAYSALSGVPSTFAPSAHTQTASTITDFATAAAAAAPVSSVNTLTGAVVLTKSSVGLSAVDNVADASKPVSTAQAAADAAVQAYAIQRANHTGSQAASTITGLAAVATSGSASDLSAGTLPAARLPAATTTTAGAVIVGSGLSVASGTVSAAVTSVATRTGAVTLTASDVGLGSVNNTADSAKPVSTAQAAADAAVQAYAVQRANHTGTQAASTITGLAAVATSGSAADLGTGTLPAARLPAATTTTSGAVIVGAGLSVASGTISAAVTSVAGRTGAVVLSIGDISGLQAALDDLSARIASGGGGATVTISSQPSNQTASGGAATFSVMASVTPATTLSYQWQRQALGTGSYANVSGANSATLSLTGLTNAANNGDNYRVIVSASGATSVTSNAASLSVAASAALLTIARNNGTSTFTGSGTTASPFFRATATEWTNADGLSRYSWTASGAATVTVAFNFSDDQSEGYQAYVRKNGATVGSSVNSGPATRTFTVVSGDVITVGADNAGFGQYFDNVSVSAA